MDQPVDIKRPAQDQSHNLSVRLADARAAMQTGGQVAITLTPEDIAKSADRLQKFLSDEVAKNPPAKGWDSFSLRPFNEGRTVIAIPDAQGKPVNYVAMRQRDSLVDRIVLVNADQLRKLLPEHASAASLTKANFLDSLLITPTWKDSSGQPVDLKGKTPHEMWSRAERVAITEQQFKEPGNTNETIPRSYWTVQNIKPGDKIDASQLLREGPRDPDGKKTWLDASGNPAVLNGVEPHQVWTEMQRFSITERQFIDQRNIEVARQRINWTTEDYPPGARVDERKILRRGEDSTRDLLADPAAVAALKPQIDAFEAAVANGLALKPAFTVPVEAVFKSRNVILELPGAKPPPAPAVAPVAQASAPPKAPPPTAAALRREQAGLAPLPASPPPPPAAPQVVAQVAIFAVSPQVLQTMKPPVGADVHSTAGYNAAVNALEHIKYTYRSSEPMSSKLPPQQIEQIVGAWKTSDPAIGKILEDAYKEMKASPDGVTAPVVAFNKASEALFAAYKAKTPEAAQTRQEIPKTVAHAEKSPQQLYDTIGLAPVLKNDGSPVTVQTPSGMKTLWVQNDGKGPDYVLKNSSELAASIKAMNGKLNETRDPALLESVTSGVGSLTQYMLAASSAARGKEADYKAEDTNLPPAVKAAVTRMDGNEAGAEKIESNITTPAAAPIRPPQV